MIPSHKHTGAPGEYFQSVAKKTTNTEEPKAKKLKIDESVANTKDGKRVTFMVNIWLNHCPIESGPLDDELIDKLSTPWEDTETGVDGEKRGNLKGDESYEPPFQWNVSDISSPDKLSNAESLARVSSESAASPAGVEEAVICNRHVDILFGASMKNYHNVSKLAAAEGSLPIEMEDGVFSLKVGKEVSSDEEEEEES